MLEQVTATRYVVPLREGGSLPGLVEASDDGMYVVKFRGAGQGVKVLVAEILVAGLARAVEVAVPDLVIVDMPTAIARYEADEEVQDLLNASPGTNLGMDYLPGSFGYDGSYPPPADEAARILWLDAFTANVDRTWDNPNLLVWHRRTWAIDHGAALWFHHSWPSRGSHPDRFAAQPFDATRHVLAGVADDPAPLHAELAARTRAVLEEIVGDVPDDWLEPGEGLPGPAAVRAAYVDNLTARLDRPETWLPTGSLLGGIR